MMFQSRKMTNALRATLNKEKIQKIKDDFHKHLTVIFFLIEL